MIGDPDDAVAASALDVGLYERLITDLEAAGARYRLIDHAPEGRTELVSALRGHDVAQAAKCLIVMVKIGKKQPRYALAVVPGDARLDRSIALATGDYLRLAVPPHRPHHHRTVTPAPSHNRRREGKSRAAG